MEIVNSIAGSSKLPLAKLIKKKISHIKKEKSDLTIDL